MSGPIIATIFGVLLNSGYYLGVRRYDKRIEELHAAVKAEQTANERLWHP